MVSAGLYRRRAIIFHRKYCKGMCDMINRVGGNHGRLLKMQNTPDSPDNTEKPDATEGSAPPPQTSDENSQSVKSILKKAALLGKRSPLKRVGPLNRTRHHDSTPPAGGGDAAKFSSARPAFNESAPSIPVEKQWNYPGTMPDSPVEIRENIGGDSSFHFDRNGMSYILTFDSFEITSGEGVIDRIVNGRGMTKEEAGYALDIVESELTPEQKTQFSDILERWRENPPVREDVSGTSVSMDRLNYLDEVSRSFQIIMRMPI